MSTTFNKLIVGTSVFALLLLASGVQAAPSLGFSKGRPYYGANNGASSSRSFRAIAPAYSTETRQSFSYSPSEKAVQGNIRCHGQVAAPQTSPKAETKQGAAAPKVTRRSYSYEPATPAPQPSSSIRHAGPKKEPWQYQKADPRRYSR